MNYEHNALASESLSVTDNRTGKCCTVPIWNNSIDANFFASMRSPHIRGSMVGEVSNGLRLYDEGLRNTAVRKSCVSYLDSTQGRLQYRNIDVNDLLKDKQFEDVAHLLIWGSLPGLAERRRLSKELARLMRPPDFLFDVVKAFPRDAAPTTIIQAGISAVAASQSNKIPAYVGVDLFNKDMSLVDAEIPRALSSLAMVVSVVYCHIHNLVFTPAREDATFVENLIHMMLSNGNETAQLKEEQVNYLQQAMILYAEHGMANGTTTFLTCASTRADPLTSLVAALSSLYGPLHGGALEVVHHMLRRIGGPENVPQLIANVKARKEPLYGYGHRIYRVVDPRSKALRAMLAELHEDVKASNSRLLETALEIDRIACSDEFFVKRQIRANADLFTSLVLTTVGFPSDFIVPILSVARNVGMMAHWREFMSESRGIWRPTHIFMGMEAEPRAKI